MMAPIEYVWLAIYVFALICLFTYGMNCYLLMVLYRLNRPAAIRRHKKLKNLFYQSTEPKDWPHVTIQLPIFNERYVVERLIESVCRLDYPANLLEIQVLDDSTDDTIQIAQSIVEKMKARGTDIVIIHRQNRSGFKAGALTEDLDLSYRAQLRGWKLSFVSEVVCPAEIPVTINAFKSQQHRWAKGSIQTAKKNLARLWRADISLLVKIQAFLHLTHYMVHPMMLLVVLTSIPILYSQWFFNTLAYPAVIFAVLLLTTFGPSSMYLFSQRILYPDWKSRIKYLPFLMFLGTGIAVNNTKAVIEALLNIESSFIRTPKYGVRKQTDRWVGKQYSTPLNSIMVLEFFWVFIRWPGCS